MIRFLLSLMLLLPTTVLAQSKQRSAPLPPECAAAIGEHRRHGEGKAFAIDGDTIAGIKRIDEMLPWNWKTAQLQKAAA